MTLLVLISESALVQVAHRDWGTTNKCFCWVHNFLKWFTKRSSLILFYCFLWLMFFSVGVLFKKDSPSLSPRPPPLSSSSMWKCHFKITVKQVLWKLCSKLSCLHVSQSRLVFSLSSRSLSLSAQLFQTSQSLPMISKHS